MPAQPPALPAQPPAAAARDTSARPSYAFDIPAGPLGDALAAFERVTGLRVDTRDAVGDARSAGASGTFTATQALARLVAGTEFTYVFGGGSAVTVRRRATTLGTVAVVGTRATPGAVSSPKYTAPPVDIPRTIAVVGQEQLRQQAVTSLRDAVRNVPGITINAGEGGGGMPGDNFNVRGFSAASDVFVDGVRDVSGYARESFNLEQVEVTKGPSSGVNGRGSTGGSINMVTKTPGLRAARSAAVQVGSANQRRVTLDVNQPLAGLGLGGAAFRLNAVGNDAGVAGNEVIENENWGIAPSLAFGLGSPTQVTLSYLHSDQRNTPAYGVENFNAVPTVDTRRFFGLRTLDFEDIRSDQFSARVEHQLAPAVRVRTLFTSGSSDVGRIVTPVNPTTGARSPKTHRFDNDIVASQTTLSSEFRTGPLAHSLVVGVDASREKSLRGGYNILNKTYPAIRDLGNPTADESYRSDYLPTVTRAVRATSVGAYAFETLKISRLVELSGNLRWDSYKPEYTDSASRAANIVPNHARAVSGSAALVVKPRPSGSVYASYGTSFNPSTENLSQDALSAAVTLPPERSRSYELGTKWELFQRRLLASAAAFRTEKTNARTSDPANPGLGTILAGRQRVDGAELSATGQVTARWSVVGGYAYMDSKYVESLNQSQVGTGLLNVPRHSVNAWSTYQLTKALTVGGGARYVDRRLLRTTATATGTTTTITQVYVPSYHAYDAVASYRVTTAVGVQLNAYNLTDKLYYDSGRMWVPAAGRAFSLTTSLTF